MNAKDNPFNLEGEVILVTGGGTGLGFGMAKALASAGADVVIAGRRANVLDEAQKAIAVNRSRIHTVVHDVTQFDTGSHLIETAERLAGRPLTALVNNAGLHLKKEALHTSTEEFETILRAHVLGAHALTAAALPGMLQRRKGNILFIASMASLFGIPKVIAYSAAKSAFVGMVRTLASEVSGEGVRVNAIAPGWIDSPMMQKALSDDPARAQKILSRTPMKEFGKAEDIGNAAVYLCSKAARFVTGVVLPVDGGVSIGF